MAKVIILGAGLGGVACAYEMKKKLGAKHQVTLVGSSPYFEFTPSNPWVAVGWRKPEQTRVELAGPLKAQGRRLDPETRAERSTPRRRSSCSPMAPRNPTITWRSRPARSLRSTRCRGSGRTVTPSRSARRRMRSRPGTTTRNSCKQPGPIVIGAVASASCFGPAYEMAMIVDTDLRKRKLRDKVPMTFVTSEPYIGHMGLGGVGDSKGLMESTLRQRHINWVTNAKVTSVEAGVVNVSEFNEDGAVRKEHKLPFKWSMILPAFKGVDAVAGVPELCNPRGFVLIDEFQRSRKYRNIFAAGVCVAIPPVEVTPVPTGAPKTGLHDRIDGLGDLREHRGRPRGTAGRVACHLERDLPRRLRRHRRGVRRAAADSAAQRHLGARGQVGASREDRVREVFPAQGARPGRSRRSTRSTCSRPWGSRPSSNDPSARRGPAAAMLASRAAGARRCAGPLRHAGTHGRDTGRCLGDGAAAGPLPRRGASPGRGRRARREAARAQRWPTVAVGGTYAQLDDSPAFDFSFTGLPVTPPELFDDDKYVSGAATVTVPLFTGGRISGSIAAAAARERGAGAQLRTATADVKLAVAGAYVDVLRTRKSHAVARSNVETLESLARDTASMFERELVPKNELLAVQVALADARQNELRAANAAEVAARGVQPVAGAAIGPPGRAQRHPRRADRAGRRLAGADGAGRSATDGTRGPRCPGRGLRAACAYRALAGIAAGRT